MSCIWSTSSNLINILAEMSNIIKDFKLKRPTYTKIITYSDDKNLKYKLNANALYESVF